MTAALIAPAIPNITAERESTGERYTREKVNWALRAAELRNRAEDQLEAILEIIPTDDDVRPTMFTLAHGYRGRL